MCLVFLSLLRTDNGYLGYAKRIQMYTPSCQVLIHVVTQGLNSTKL